jgi:hypothetical protein
MADPVSNAILDHVITTIGAIESGATYSRTVRECKRLVSVPQDIAQFDSVFVFDAGTTKDYLTGQTRCEMSLMLFCAVQDDDPATAIDQIAADVEKALSVDITRNDKAIDTKITAIRKELSEDNSPEGYCEMDVLIIYRHQEGDPYTEI